MRGVGRISECHPEKRHKAFGLCITCYEKNRRENSEKYKTYQKEYQKKHKLMHPEIYRKSAAKWWKSKGRFRLSHVKRLYGITPDDYWKIFEDQKGKCKICNTTIPGGRFRLLAVDHDHISGNIRGLLCCNCNYLLGYAMDNTEILLSALLYINAFAKGKR